MKEAYPVYIAKHDADLLVYVPDLDIYTEGNSPANAIAMARDAICGKAAALEAEQICLPEASDYETAREKTIKNADDEQFQYSKGVCTLVDIDLEEYRRKLENRSVKKNCTIPYRLSEAADKAGINYSRVLQDALMEKLHMG